MGNGPGVLALVNETGAGVQVPDGGGLEEGAGPRGAQMEVPASLVLQPQQAHQGHGHRGPQTRANAGRQLTEPHWLPGLVPWPCPPPWHLRARVPASPTDTCGPSALTSASRLCARPDAAPRAPAPRTIESGSGHAPVGARTAGPVGGGGGCSSRLRAAPAPQPAPCPRRSRPGEWPRGAR